MLITLFASIKEKIFQKCLIGDCAIFRLNKFGLMKVEFSGLFCLMTLKLSFELKVFWQSPL